MPKSQTKVQIGLSLIVSAGDETVPQEKLLPFHPACRQSSPWCAPWYLNKQDTGLRLSGRNLAFSSAAILVGLSEPMANEHRTPFRCRRRRCMTVPLRNSVFGAMVVLVLALVHGGEISAGTAVRGSDSGMMAGRVERSLLQVGPLNTRPSVEGSDSRPDWAYAAATDDPTFSPTSSPTAEPSPAPIEKASVALSHPTKEPVSMKKITESVPISEFAMQLQYKPGSILNFSSEKLTVTTIVYLSDYFRSAMKDEGFYFSYLVLTEHDVVPVIPSQDRGIVRPGNKEDSWVSPYAVFQGKSYFSGDRVPDSSILDSLRDQAFTGTAKSQFLKFLHTADDEAFRSVTDIAITRSIPESSPEPMMPVTNSVETGNPTSDGFNTSIVASLTVVLIFLVLATCVVYSLPSRSACKDSNDDEDEESNQRTGQTAINDSVRINVVDRLSMLDDPAEDNISIAKSDSTDSLWSMTEINVRFPAVGISHGRTPVSIHNRLQRNKAVLQVANARARRESSSVSGSETSVKQVKFAEQPAPKTESKPALDCKDERPRGVLRNSDRIPIFASSVDSPRDKDIDVLFEQVWTDDVSDSDEETEETEADQSEEENERDEEESVESNQRTFVEMTHRNDDGSIDVYFSLVDVEEEEDEENDDESAKTAEYGVGGNDEENGRNAPDEKEQDVEDLTDVVLNRDYKVVGMGTLPLQNVKDIPLKRSVRAGHWRLAPAREKDCDDDESKSPSSETMYTAPTTPKTPPSPPHFPFLANCVIPSEEPHHLT